MPSASRTDPETSHEAAEAVTVSGVAQRQCEIVLRLVEEHPGLSSYRLAELSQDLNRYQIARRLPELEEAKLVHRRKRSDGTYERDRNGVLWFPGAKVGSLEQGRLFG
jgi:predicted transcriptional regulator